MPKHNKTFICEECVVVFQTHTKITGKPFCPNCGSRKYTLDYEGRNQTKNLSARCSRWTSGELAVIKNAIEKDKDLHQIAWMLGRTVSAVRTKNWRIKRGGL